jgi:eukaryotic-like serine/threonine-protein kinase
MPLPAGTRLGPYEILSSLGAGGMGEVYRARDTRLDRDVAVKVLPENLARDPDALARFEREAKAVAALSHPNILAIHDFGRTGEISYAVTELLEGETLRDRVAAAPLPPRKAIEYAQQVALGLAAAHDRGIVHRDLKPDNLFVTRDGLVKILDFGLAQMATSIPKSDGTNAPTTAGQTDPGMVLGTAGYMSPEQVRGRTVDHRSDLFSVGLVLYEIVSGKRAFQADSSVETLMAVLRDDPPRLSSFGREIPAGLEELVTHCLEKSPEERFQSARDLAFALHVLEREASAARTPAPVAAPHSSGARSAVGSSPAHQPPSIAVLPLRNLSADPGNEYFSDGLTEEIIDALSKIGALRVAARTSSFAFKGKDEDVRKIAERLNVRTILEGSVRRSGDRIRITARLVGAADGYDLWSDHFDADMSDVFAVQDEIARAIAGALKVRLLPAEEAAIATPGTRNVEAYNRYLKGRYFFAQRSPRKAIEEFEAAIAADPDYAAAYTGLADSYGIFGFYGGIDTRDAYRRSRAAALRAKELQPDSAETLVALGILEHYFGWNFDEEVRLLERAIELAPRSAAAYTWLGLLHGLRGRTEEGLRVAREAARLEPLSGNMQTNVGLPLYMARRYEEAIVEFRKATSLDPGAMYAFWVKGLCFQSMGAFQEAITAYEQSVMLSHRELTWPVALLGGAYGAAGRRGDAERVLRELEEWGKREYVPPYHVAHVHLGTGELETAIDCLERAVDERNALAWWIGFSPFFDSLRPIPRFQRLLERIAPE